MLGSVDLPDQVADLLRAGGLDELGVVSCDSFDAAAPESLRCHRQLSDAACALVVGAGRELFHALRDPGVDPLDRHTENVIEGAVCALEGAGHGARAIFSHVPRDDGYVDLVALGRAAGLGWPSRLGLLLHPQRGPWWSLRGVILTTLPLAPGAPLPGCGPCSGCPAPCTEACPSAAPQPEGFSIHRCAATRQAPEPCASTCHARRACPIGKTQAYPREAEAHLMAASRGALLERANNSVPAG
ncbi:MAG: hypothetical protein JRH01_04220 [Deltaproteobacteria bacterium]|nr:hypothetical protein [Deltaproteobacteria bacterium]MBW2395387.1 hypothetical protein [Deltaproteobacteria bacterium]